MNGPNSPLRWVIYPYPFGGVFLTLLISTIHVIQTYWHNYCLTEWKRKSASLLKVLLIERNKLLKWSIIQMLKEKGMGIYSEDTCLEAVEVAKMHDFHLIFAEVGADKSESLKTLRQIQKIQPKSRIVLMTSFPESEIKEQLGGLEVAAILEKPFELEKIQDAVLKATDFR